MAYSPIMLPVFPVQAVLLPGGELTLRVSDARARAMVKDCLADGSRAFGVLFDPKGNEVFADVARVGTVAHIASHTEYDNGTWEIRVNGGERFKLGDIDESTRAYWRSDVRVYVDDLDITRGDALLHTTQALFRVYGDLLCEVDQGLIDQEFSVMRPEHSFDILERMVLPEEKRQKALEICSQRQRFELLCRYLQVEIETLRFLMAGAENEGFALRLN